MDTVQWACRVQREGENGGEEGAAMTKRIRNPTRWGLLPLIVLLVLCGGCSSDRQLRADIREWMKNPHPCSFAEVTKKSEELNAKYAGGLVAAALHEAVRGYFVAARQARKDATGEGG